MANKEINGYTRVVGPSLSLDFLVDPGDGNYKKMSLEQLKDLLGVLDQLGVPGNFVATAVGPAEISLIWDPVESASDYIVQRSTAADFSVALTVVYTGSGTGYTNTGLIDVTQYYYRIKATAAGIIDSPYATDNATTLFDVDTIPDQMVFQADDSASLVLDGTNVSSWAEKLTGTPVFTMASSKPVFSASGGGNNKPYITASSTLTMASPITTTPLTYMIVVRTPTISTAGALLRIGSIGGANGLAYNTGTNGKASNFYTGETPFYLVPTFSLVRTQWMMVIMKFADKATMDLIINDQPRERFAVTAAAAYVPTLLNLGTYSGMQVAEVRLFGRDITTDEVSYLQEYAIAKYGLENPPKCMIMLGDSHTAGVQSGTPSGSPYGQRFVANTSFVTTFQPVSGSCAVNNNSPFDFPDQLSRFNQSKYSDHWLHLQYGTNDCATASAPYGWTSWSQWKADYKGFIQGFIDNGFDPAKIIIFTPPYSTAGYVSGNLSTVRTAILEIADELNLNLVDWYQLCVNAGLDVATVSGGDGIHVPDSFHNLAYNALTAITDF